MKKTEIDFPSKMELDETLERIKNNVHTNTDVDKIINWYFEINLLSKHEPNFELIMYRCSRISDETKRDVNNPNSFSYPPVKHCKMGRCNISKNPVLYLSIDKFTPFFEINATVGEKIYLSEWIFKPINKIFEQRLFFSPSFFIGKDSNAAFFASSMEEQIKEQFKSLTDDGRDNLFYFLEKMNGIIRLESSDYYTLTSKLCTKIFNGFYTENAGKINVDIISYPSVSTNLESVNFAFNKKIVDGGIVHLTKVYKVLVTGINKGEVKYNLLKEATIINNNVNWNNIILH